MPSGKDSIPEETPKAGERKRVILCPSALDDVLLYAIAMKCRARRAAKLAGVPKKPRRGIIAVFPCGTAALIFERRMAAAVRSCRR